MSITLRRPGVLVAVAAAIVVWHFVDPAGGSDTTAPETTASVPQEGTYHRGGGPVDLQKLLKGVEVVQSRPSVPGYDRDCGTGHACSFGQAWSDDVDVQFGHNGCDTRNDLLRASLRDLGIREGTNGCVVESGTFTEPYTGQRVEFTKAEAYKVQIDHVYPLARAWDMGASTWSIQKRTDFANDPRNLVVADGSANASKSDQGPGEWLPVNAGYRCTYVATYLKVARRYQLPITQEDRDTASRLSKQCSASDPESRGKGEGQ